MALFSAVKEVADLFAGLAVFEQQIRALANKVGLRLSDFHCDHISVRCHQNSTADRWKKGLLQCGSLLSANQIAGRSIYLFDLAQPLQLAGLTIDCVELPYPGSRFYPHEGWEHIELVLPCEPDRLHQQALALLSDDGLTAPELKLKMSQPQREGERLANPTLAISDERVTIKFHPWSIRQIVAQE